MWEIYDINLQELYKYNSDPNNSSRLNDTIAENEHDLITFSKKFLTKVSPYGKKNDSINFNPLMGFKIGAQFTTNHP